LSKKFLAEMEIHRIGPRLDGPITIFGGKFAISLLFASGESSSGSSSLLAGVFLKRVFKELHIKRCLCYELLSLFLTIFH
jgi:hypothetical protein